MGFFGVKGPKQLLASAIATALNEFFEVDEKSIESNLLRDAKIVLRKVKLRSQRTNCTNNNSSDEVVVMDTTGSVEEVCFKWTWVLGSSTDKMWVKDVSFTIRGLDLKMQLSIETTEKAEREDSCQGKIIQNKNDCTADSKIHQEGRIEIYIRNQVENIIDALTLVVKDFKFTLVLPIDIESSLQDSMSSGIIVGGKQLELRSLGRQQGTLNVQNQDRTLIQQLSIGSFYIDVFTLDNDAIVSTFPFLAPVSYEATATKQGGKRFGSIGTGLLFEGRILSCKKKHDSNGASDIIFHIGTSQLGIFSRLGNLMLANKPDINEGEKQRTENIKSVSLDAMTEPSQNIAENLMEDRLKALKEEALKSSVFTIPISSISLVLPNNVKITLESFIFNYYLDGTVLTVKGADGAGILIDDFPLVAIKRDGNTGVKTYWMVDFVSSRFSIEDSGNESINGVISSVQVKMSPTVLKKILDGINMTINATSSLDLSSGFSSDSTQDKRLEGSEELSSIARPKPWVIAIQQNIEIMLEKYAENETISDWLKINVNSLYISVPFSPSSICKSGGIIVGPSSRGGVLITIPQISQIPDKNIILIDGGVSFEAESLKILNEIMDLVNAFSSLDFGQSNKSSKENVSNELQFQIPFIDANILEEALSLRVVDIVATERDLKCSKSIIRDASGISLIMKQVMITFRSSIELSVDLIETFHLPGVISLLEPITNVVVSYRDNSSIDVKMSKVVGLLLDNPEKTEISNSKYDSDSKSAFEIPIAVNVTIDRVTLKKDLQTLKQRQTKISIKKIAFCVDPNKSTQLVGYLPLSLNLDEVTSDLFDLKKTKTSAILNLKTFDEVKNLMIDIPEIIKIHAGASVADWSKMFVKLFRRRKKVEAKVAKPVKFPHAQITPLKIKVSYSGIDTKIHTSAFKGDSTTNSDDLVKFYKAKVLHQAPCLLEDVSLLGVKVVDTAVLVGGHSLGLAGALVGVCGVDAIKSQLRAGKKSRGGETGDSYKIGDFFRGMNSAVSNATKSGAAIRSGNKIGDASENKKERKGNVVDYTIGASSAAVTYVDKNQAKLAGAGAASAAMVVGSVLLGPVGTVAGAVVAGTMTEKIMKLSEVNTDCSVNSEKSDFKLSSSFRLVPQGLLYKRRDLLKTEWRPRWFVINVKKRILDNHTITKNAPPTVNMLNIFSKPASKEASQEERIDFHLEPQDSIDISSSKIEISEEITSSKHNLFAFKVTALNRSWYLATTTEESRSMWVAMLMDLSDLNTYDDILRNFQ